MIDPHEPKLTPNHVILWECHDASERKDIPQLDNLIKDEDQTTISNCLTNNVENLFKNYHQWKL